jgi:hypothetical protein
LISSVVMQVPLPSQRHAAVWQRGLQSAAILSQPAFPV